MNYGRAIKQPPTVSPFVCADRSDDRRDSSGRRDDIAQRFVCAFDDVAILKPILRSIAVRHDFGKNNEVGFIALRFFYCRNYLRGVAGEVAIDRIYLGDCNFHLLPFLPLFDAGQKRSLAAFLHHRHAIAAIVVNNLVHDVVNEQHTAAGCLEEVIGIKGIGDGVNVKPIAFVLDNELRFRC